MGASGKVFIASIGVWAGFAGFLAQAQEPAPTTSFSAPHGYAIPGTNSYLGLSLGRGLTSNCPATQLTCESRDRSAQMYAGRMFGPHWGAEVSYVDTGRLLRPLNESRGQGLNLSVVGRAHVASVGVFGKVGTTYGRSDTSVMGNAAASGPEQGFGLSYGGGMSYDITPRLSAKVEWESYDLRMQGGPVRSTSLGLQYRY
jgi:opacity protein-like surface antigen